MSIINNSTKKQNHGAGPGAPGREEAAPDPARMGGIEEKRKNALSKGHIRPRIIYYEGASLLKTTKGKNNEQVGGGIRGSIAGFSKKSRRRLMYLIGQVRRDAELPNFVTLTYPDNFPTVGQAKRDLKVFLQRLNRRFPDVGYIWKLEPQERGAPHYHLLVWGVATRILLAWVAINWYEIAGQGDINAWRFLWGLLPGSQPCVSQVRSWRGVWSYASKYLGKTFEVAEWGQQWTGRFWGVGGRHNVPFGVAIELLCTFRDIVQIMRLQRRFSGIKKAHGNSLTIFCNCDHWIEKLTCANF